MAIEGRYFPGQAPSERIFLVLRRDVITYISFLVIAMIMMIPLAILVALYIHSPDTFSSELVNSLLTLGGSAYLLFIIGLLLYGFVDYYLDVYIITDERIVDIRQIGFFRREIAELHLREVQDVSAKVEGFFPTMFHYGDVHIQTAGERENFVFYSVPHPYRVSKKIADLHESQIERDRILTEQNIEQGVITRIQPPAQELQNNPADPRYIESLPMLDRNNSENPSLSENRTGDNFSGANDESEPSFEQYQQPPQSLLGDGVMNEQNSDRGISDEQGLEEPGKPETNVDAGLDKIDQYLEEVKKSDGVELKEGEVKKITND